MYLSCLLEEWQNTCKKLLNLPGINKKYNHTIPPALFICCAFLSTPGSVESNIVDTMLVIIKDSEEIERLSRDIADACAEDRLKKVLLCKCTSVIIVSG